MVTQSEIINKNFKQLSEENKVNNGYLTGGVSTEKKMFEQVKEMKRSTFDLSKFEVVGSPSISEDGIASGLINPEVWSEANVVKIPKFDTSKEWTITLAIKLSSNASSHFLFGEGGDFATINFSQNCVFRLVLGNPTIQDMLFDNTTLIPIDKWMLLEISHDGVNSYTYKDKYINDTNWRQEKTISATSKFRIIGDFLCLQGDNVTYDLKYTSVTVDGIEVFNGNKTGVDTINNIEIPYTLSKTGSKIVDSIYRDRVQEAYNYNGYANYYTLSDIDFTLPKGEVYGMIDTKLDTHASNLSIQGKELISGLGMPSNRYIDLTLGASGTEYTAPANGYFVLRALDENIRIASIETDTLSSTIGSGRGSFPVGWHRVFLPVAKGKGVTVNYVLSNNILPQLLFVYAEGEA